MVVGKVTVKMAPVRRIMRRLGVTESGDVQITHTQNVLKRIRKYMPFRSGALSKHLTFADGTTAVTSRGPYARYLYFGKVMVGRQPKTVTNTPLNYTTPMASEGEKGRGNKLAGPFWDRRLVAAEGRIMQQELQDYVKRRAAKK